MAVLRRAAVGDVVSWRASVTTIVLCAATYGAALGSWHSSRLALYDAVKLPLMMLVTAAITALFNWIIAALFGVVLAPRRAVELTLMPLAVASLVLASLAPVAFFFTKALPPPSELQRTLHNFLYVTHTLLVSAGGVAGTTLLRSLLVAHAGGDEARARRIRWSWIAAYAFVAGEVGWALRPFVGSVYLPVAFLRDDALHGNVYEFLFTDALPHLLDRLGDVLNLH